MEYKEQIKDGRWQRMRLKLMERDDFKCRCCKSQNDLVIHHLYYLKGKKIWEYDTDALVTICQSCHDKIHIDLCKLSGLLAFKILTGEWDPFDLIDYKAILKP